MDRINSKDTADIGGGRRGFKDQDAAKGIRGTVVNAPFMNALQEELLKIIEEAGLAPDEKDWGQLAQAIGKSAFPKFGWQVSWMAVKSRVTAIPPDNAKEGDIYYIPGGGAGAWEGKSGQLAIAQKGGGWLYAVPKDGHGFGLPDGRLFIKQNGVYKELKFDAKDKTGKLADLEDINNAAAAAARAILTKVAADSKTGAPRFTFETPQKAFEGVKVLLLDLSDIDNAKDAQLRTILTRSEKGGTFLSPQKAFEGVKVPYKNIDDFPVNKFCPAGFVGKFAMKNPPSGWLKCNGAWVGRKDYPELYAAIGDSFGLDDRGITFRLPDMRGEFARGWIDDRTDIPEQTGRVLGSAEEDALKKHFHVGHTDLDGKHANTYKHGLFGSSTGGRSNWSGGGEVTEWTNTSGEHIHEFKTMLAGDADETRTRNIALLYCIKY